MMGGFFRKTWNLGAVALALSACASFAQTTAVTITGVGDGSSVTNPSYFGVYVDPYTATVGGVANTNVICDDWSDNTFVGESWTANVSTVASVSSGNMTPIFAPAASKIASPLTPGQLYDEVAWLATQLLANPTNSTNQAEVSFAIWELTYSYAPTPQMPDPKTFLSGSPNGSTYQNAISGSNGLLAQAAAAVNSGYSGAGWEILTPVAGTPGPPQEFLVYTPESSAMILFSADMLGLLGLVIVFRRRLFRPSH